MLQETIKSMILIASGSAPANTDAVATTAPILINPKISTGTNDEVGTGSLANSKGYADGSNVTAEFDITSLLRAPASLGTAPELGKCFKIAGLSETINAGTSVVYKLGGITANGTGQAKHYMDGFKRDVTGMAANLKIIGKIGEPLKATLSFKGITSPAATAEENPVVTLNQGIPIIMRKDNTVLTVAGAAVSLDNFELDIGGTLQRSYTTGTNMFYIENFNPKLTFTAIKTKATDEAAWTQASAGGTSAIALTVGAPGNQFELTCPYAFSESPDESSDKGRVSMKRSFVLENGGTANNNFTITFK